LDRPYAPHCNFHAARTCFETMITDWTPAFAGETSLRLVGRDWWVSAAGRIKLLERFGDGVDGGGQVALAALGVAQVRAVGEAVHGLPRAVLLEAIRYVETARVRACDVVAVWARLAHQFRAQRHDQRRLEDAGMTRQVALLVRAGADQCVP